MRRAMATSADLLHVTMMKTDMMVAEEDPHHVTAIMKMALGADPHLVTGTMKMAIGADPHLVMNVKTKKADADEDLPHVTSVKTKR